MSKMTQIFKMSKMLKIFQMYQQSTEEKNYVICVIVFFVASFLIFQNVVFAMKNVIFVIFVAIFLTFPNVELVYSDYSKNKINYNFLTAFYLIMPQAEINFNNT